MSRSSRSSSVSEALGRCWSAPAVAPSARSTSDAVSPACAVRATPPSSASASPSRCQSGAARTKHTSQRPYVESAQASTSSTGSFSVTCSGAASSSSASGRRMAARRPARGVRRRGRCPRPRDVRARRAVSRRRLPGAGALLFAPLATACKRQKKLATRTRARGRLPGRVEYMSCGARETSSRAEQATAGVSAAPRPLPGPQELPQGRLSARRRGGRCAPAGGGERPRHAR